MCEGDCLKHSRLQSSVVRRVTPRHHRDRARNHRCCVREPVVHAADGEGGEECNRARRAPGRGLCSVPLRTAMRADDGGDRPDQPDHGERIGGCSEHRENRQGRKLELGSLSTRHGRFIGGADRRLEIVRPVACPEAGAPPSRAVGGIPDPCGLSGASTAAPSRPNPRATAPPKVPPAPVTSATRPVKRRPSFQISSANLASCCQRRPSQTRWTRCNVGCAGAPECPPSAAASLGGIATFNYGWRDR